MSDDPLGPPLAECPVCGAIGLPERIAVHDCAAFRARRAARQAPTTAAAAADDTQEPTPTEGADR